MPERLRTPTEDPPLRVIEHGGFFEVFDAPPKHAIGTVDGAAYALIYDGQPKPRLTVDLDGWRVSIDVETATVTEGGIAKAQLAKAFEYARDRRDALGTAWLAMHERFERDRAVLQAIASELTDPNDLEIDDDGDG